MVKSLCFLLTATGIKEDSYLYFWLHFVKCKVQRPFLQFPSLLRPQLPSFVSNALLPAPCSTFSPCTTTSELTQPGGTVAAQGCAGYLSPSGCTPFPDPSGVFRTLLSQNVLNEEISWWRYSSLDYLDYHLFWGGSRDRMRRVRVSSQRQCGSL